jgi:hypothetical protein
VKNDFLNGELREDVYMRSPLGYSVSEGMTCHLHRSLYGLKQTLRTWFQRFASMITAAGFSANTHDPLSLSTCHLVVGLFSFFMWMT